MSDELAGWTPSGKSSRCLIGEIGVRGSPSFKMDVGLTSISIPRPFDAVATACPSSSSCITSSVKALTTDNHPRPDLTSTSSHNHGREDSSS